ncbi:hypothetical protein EVAR_28257_1 [Eumeta japonica]|uniref:Uncharacterized protein n=1 Tax=Eumeta variegata TaxID=151549 RepID=A0A4C1V5L7_EUMVA|nr:hypothetical protein EVAR_28257_1 [Eumeta japonica]
MVTTGSSPFTKSTINLIARRQLIVLCTEIVQFKEDFFSKHAEKPEENTDEQDDDLDIQYQDWLDDELPDFNDDDVKLEASQIFTN